MATIIEEKKAHYQKQIREATEALARLDRLEKNFVAMVNSFETQGDFEWALASLINSAVEHGMPLGEGFDWGQLMAKYENSALRCPCAKHRGKAVTSRCKSEQPSGSD